MFHVKRNLLRVQLVQQVEQRVQVVEPVVLQLYAPLLAAADDLTAAAEMAP